jgi:long-chain acyl-CoA synthetase
MSETTDTTTETTTATSTPPLSERRQMAMVGMGLAWHAQQAPDGLAIASEHGNRTFAALNGHANQLARAMRRRGVTPGDSLGLVCSNRAEFPETLAAGLRIGLRNTPINWHLNGEEIAYILNDCEAKVLVADARFAAACAEAARQTPSLVACFAVGGAIDGFESYEDALAAESPADVDDPVLGRQMLYTSGTTGRPKGVNRPTAGIAADPDTPAGTDRAAEQGETPGAYRDGDVHLCTGPAYHAAPLGISLNRPLAVGAAVVLMDGWSPEETLRLIEQYKVTHSHMVATMFHRLLGLPDEVKRAYDTSSLRYVIHGAAPCPVEVKKGMIEWWGPVIYEYYAATEGGGTFVTPEDWMKKPGTVGRPRGNQVVEVWDADGKQCPPDEIGTVYIKAPERGRFEYYKDPGKTASAYKGDYFTLGDMGYYDSDGDLFLTGRTAELIISGGVNIYPAEVDAVLLQHPAVADAATVGVPNDDWGEEVKSVVQLKDGVEPAATLAAELIGFTRDRLAHYKCPRTIDWDPALPRHDTGKIYRRLVRDRYWEGRTRQI